MIESRRGSTGHQANPWFAIEAGDRPDENAGEVWFGALAWSGSWRITVEQDQLDAVRVTGGFNPFDFGYVLKPGRVAGVAGVSMAGIARMGSAGHRGLLHHFEIAHILPHRVGEGDTAAPKPRPVIYNSWEATEFSVSEEGQIATGREGGGARSRSLCDGRRLVWAAQG